MSKIQIVIGEKEWILEAISRQWLQRLREVYGEANVTCVHPRPIAGAHTYIHFIYIHAQPVLGARNIVIVTHIDLTYKAFILLKLFRQGVEFAVMSLQTKHLLEDFFPGSIVHCITPQSIQFSDYCQSKKGTLTFGLFFRLYPDKRKGNALVKSLIYKIASCSSDVKLIIYGAGFEPFLQGLDYSNIIYDDSPFSSSQYKSYMQQCDYVIYFGFDEGSVSILDSACISIPVLATRQGYHLDINLPKGSMLFLSGSEVLKAAELLIDSFDRNGALCCSDPASLFDQEQCIPKYRSLWLFDALIMPFKANPFRAPNDLQASVTSILLGSLRYMLLRLGAYSAFRKLLRSGR